MRTENKIDQCIRIIWFLVQSVKMLVEPNFFFLWMSNSLNRSLTLSSLLSFKIQILPIVLANILLFYQNQLWSVTTELSTNDITSSQPHISWTKATRNSYRDREDHLIYRGQPLQVTRSLLLHTVNVLRDHNMTTPHVMPSAICINHNHFLQIHWIHWTIGDIMFCMHVLYL